MNTSSIINRFIEMKNTILILLAVLGVGITVLSAGEQVATELGAVLYYQAIN